MAMQSQSGTSPMQQQSHLGYGGRGFSKKEEEGDGPLPFQGLEKVGCFSSSCLKRLVQFYFTAM
jgi:hypothetical protein